MTIFDNIRRVLAEDAAHPDVTHEVFLRQETVDALVLDNLPFLVGDTTGAPPSILGVPHVIQDMARDTIVTYRAGRPISSTYI